MSVMKKRPPHTLLPHAINNSRPHRNEYTDGAAKEERPFLKVITAICIALLTVITPLWGKPHKTIHVYVALCDNKNQGIIPVPAKLGNGEDIKNNLYWGAAAGVKTFFKRSKEWRLVYSMKNLDSNILERCIFKHRFKNVVLLADAYRGSEIKRATTDFLKSSAGYNAIEIRIGNNLIEFGGASDLIAYVGHNGLMDFNLEYYPKGKDRKRREVIIISCKSKWFFDSALKSTGAHPLLWTTGLMAAEAYTLKGAIDGWIRNESNNRIRLRAAQSYHKYQKCGLRAAKKLLVTGW